MQTTCPIAFGPHSSGRYHVVLLNDITDEKKKNSVECGWRAAVTCDGRIVVEAPTRSCKQDAMMMLSEVLAAKLGTCVAREWEAEDGQTGVAADEDGGRFAAEK